MPSRLCILLAVCCICLICAARSQNPERNLKDCIFRLSLADHGQQVSMPTVTPGGKFWLRKQGRPLLEAELRAAQGMVIFGNPTSPHARELIGQGMASHCLIQAIVAAKSML